MLQAQLLFLFFDLLLQYLKHGLALLEFLELAIQILAVLHVPLYELLLREALRAVLAHDPGIRVPLALKGPMHLQLDQVCEFELAMVALSRLQLLALDQVHEKVVFLGHGAAPFPVWAPHLVVFAAELVICQASVQHNLLALRVELAPHLQIGQTLPRLLVRLFQL